MCQTFDELWNISTSVMLQNIFQQISNLAKHHRHLLSLINYCCYLEVKSELLLSEISVLRLTESIVWLDCFEILVKRTNIIATWKTCLDQTRLGLEIDFTHVAHIVVHSYANLCIAVMFGYKKMKLQQHVHLNLLFENLFSKCTSLLARLNLLEIDHQILLSK